MTALFCELGAALGVSDGAVELTALFSTLGAALGEPDCEVEGAALSATLFGKTEGALGDAEGSMEALRVGTVLVAIEAPVDGAPDKDADKLGSRVGDKLGEPDTFLEGPSVGIALGGSDGAFD